MKFIFSCPVKGQIFETDKFSIIENNGIITDNQGTRQLDAKIRLTSPCILCGEYHIYKACEMLCPFGDKK
ncbi:Uncharacterized protein dnl_46460 [Desulfonema limicola]|uniref:Uncharacterized protein n=1 Tax=Desulfonema limicola TaxID=45656 RepID=A0A975GIT7_9BACT|nr:hypothetical protein [Desulfonema limicola]QTA82273.1 Uncharacterized protein dnl_46460 [Desulfonema limicola]